MDTEQFKEHLMKFDLTRQEASLYESLLENGKLTGYEAAKLTGISRSNVYASLASLCEKGAAYLEENETGRKYLAVPVQEFCEEKIDQLKNEEDWLLLHAPVQKKEEEGYITISGQEAVESKARGLLKKAEERVYISAGQSFLKVVLPDLQTLSDAGKKVVIITDWEELQEPGTIYRAGDKKGQVGMIVDSSFVLSGEYGERSGNTCLYTGQRNFVEIFKEAMANEIKVIELTKGEKN